MAHRSLPAVLSADTPALLPVWWSVAPRDSFRILSEYELAPLNPPAAANAGSPVNGTADLVAGG